MSDVLVSRTIAIGDVHGCAAAFEAILGAIAPQPADTIIMLGDLVNRGPDTRRVIEVLFELRRQCHLITLMGNHEIMLLRARDDPRFLTAFLQSGGWRTLDSYGIKRNLEFFPPDHLTFLRHSLYYHETATHFFVHGNYDPTLPLNMQDKRITLWRSLREHVPGPHASGKTAVVGHTPQPGGKILDLGHLKCIDTGCCRGGWLTALDVESGQLWQAKQDGKLRVTE